MPVVPKEVIRPGCYWYTDEKTGEPRKLVVTAAMTKRWHDEGNKMRALGLTIPVPYEHDFNAHPMSAADKLKNNAGWVDKYEMRGDQLWSMVDIQDEDVAKKLPRTVRWTSPWINSFVDGDGRKWDGVISHLALTTRPRITRQEPFGSVAAALSIATEASGVARDGGYCLSRAGRLVTRKRDGRLAPQFPAAFSMWSGGVRLATPGSTAQGGGAGDDDPLAGLDDDGGDLGAGGGTSTDAGQDDPLAGLADPTQDSNGDVKMEELLCDLLQALGVPMPDESNEQEFKRHLYEAAMSKIKELTSHGMASQSGGQNKDEPLDPTKQPPDQNKPPSQNPNISHANKSKQPTNPLMPQVQQEQQPMYMSTNGASGGSAVSAMMSLEEINRIEDPTMRTMALSMYKQNEELRTRLDANERTVAGIRDSKLAEETRKRQARISILGRLGGSRVADRLQAMSQQASMALSLGDGGVVVDPMRDTLETLEAGLQNLPAMLTTESGELRAVPHPTDDSMLSAEMEKELVDDFSRMMGASSAAIQTG